MAVVKTALTFQSFPELYRIPPGPVFDKTISPRGMLHVHAKSAVAAKAAADVSVVNGSFDFPTNNSYRLSWMTAYWQWEENIGVITGMHEAACYINNALPYDTISGTSRGNQVMRRLSCGGELLVVPSTTRLTVLEWDMEAWPQIIYGDANMTAPPSMQVYFNNLTGDDDSASVFQIAAGFHMYDLEQVHNYPVNAPLPATVI